MSTIYIALIFVPEKKTHEEPLRGGSLQSLICFQRPLNMDRVEQYTNAMLFASSNAHLLLLSFFCMSWAKIIFLVLERNIVTDTFFNDDLALYMTKSWGVLMGVSKVCHVFE